MFKRHNTKRSFWEYCDLFEDMLEVFVLLLFTFMDKRDEKRIAKDKKKSSTIVKKKSLKPWSYIKKFTSRNKQK